MQHLGNPRRLFNIMGRETRIPFYTLFLLCCLCAFTPSTAMSAGLVLGAVPGERLHFDVHWMGIPAGEAVMQMDDAPPGAYAVQMTMATTGMVRLIHVLNETMRAEGQSSPAGRFEVQRYTKDQRKSKKIKWTTYQFDREMQQVHRVQKEAGRHSDERETIFLNSDETVDPITGFYALRAWPKLLPNTTLHWFVVDGDKIYCLSIAIGGSHRLKTPLGSFTAFPVRVVVENSEQFLHRKKERSQSNAIVVWLTDDIRRIPIRLEAEMAIGAVVAELVAFEDGRGEKKSIQ